MFLLFLLITDLYFLIPAVIAEIFHPIAELLTLKGILRKEAKPKQEKQQVTREAKTRFNVQCNLE